MALSKKSLIWIFVVAVILIVIAIVIYVFRCDLFKNLSSCVADPNDTNTPIPPGSGSTKWIAESAPYNIGMFGPKIKALQTALGIENDGKFGLITSGTLVSKGYAVPLSQADYDKIVKGTSSTGTKKTIDDYAGTYINTKNINGAVVRYIADGAEFKKYGKNENIGRLGASLGNGYHKLFDVAGDNSLQGLKIQDSFLKLILGL